MKRFIFLAALLAAGAADADLLARYSVASELDKTDTGTRKVTVHWKASTPPPALTVVVVRRSDGKRVFVKTAAPGEPLTAEVPPNVDSSGWLYVPEKHRFDVEIHEGTLSSPRTGTDVTRAGQGEVVSTKVRACRGKHLRWFDPANPLGPNTGTKSRPGPNPWPDPDEECR